MPGGPRAAQLKGCVSTIATWRDRAMIGRIEAALSTKMERCEAQGIVAYQEVARTRKTRIRRRLL